MDSGIWGWIAARLRRTPTRAAVGRAAPRKKGGWLGRLRLRRVAARKPVARPQTARAKQLTLLIKRLFAARKPRQPGKSRFQRRQELRLARWRKALVGWRYHVALAVVALALCGGGYAGYAVWSAARLRAQSVAVVNGRAITRSDIEAEARMQGIDPAKLDHEISRQLLNRVIERRLLVDAAMAQGVGDEPAVKAARARSDEMVVAGVLSQRITGQAKPVSDAEARAVIAAKPAMFGARETFAVDGIVCAKDALSDAVLARIDTLDQVSDFLRQAHLPVNRKVQLLDSAALPPAVNQTLGKMAPGKVFVLPQGQAELIGTVIRRIPNALPAEVQLATAREFLGKQQMQERFAHALDQLRRRAKISLHDQ